MSDISLNEDSARRILDVVDSGLCSGLGKPNPGEMCIEAAVSFALGLPHGDNPACVGAAVRGFKISLNDCHWSSNAARAKGMRKLAVAQLGSDTIDQEEFRKLLSLKSIQKLLPPILRIITLEKQADACEQAMDLETAIEAARNARSASGLEATGHPVLLGTYAYDAAAAYTAAYNSAAAAERDKILTLFADLALECLIELKSPGCQWLWLCDGKESTNE